MKEFGNIRSIARLGAAGLAVLGLNAACLQQQDHDIGVTNTPIVTPFPTPTELPTNLKETTRIICQEQFEEPVIIGGPKILAELTNRFLSSRGKFEIPIPVNFCEQFWFSSEGLLILADNVRQPEKNRIREVAIPSLIAGEVGFIGSRGATIVHESGYVLAYNWGPESQPLVNLGTKIGPGDPVVLAQPSNELLRRLEETHENVSLLAPPLAIIGLRGPDGRPSPGFPWWLRNYEGSLLGIATHP